MSNGIQKFTSEVFSIKELAEWGKFAKESGMLPATLTPMQGMAIIQTGRELGIPPFRALAVMGFVNGRLAMETKLLLALAKRDNDVQIVEIKEENDDKGAPFSATVTMKRGEETVAIPWSMEDAKKANLSTKDNWVKYPKAMLRWRSICDGIRILAPDLMLGLVSKEEAEDLEPVAPLAFDPAKEVKPPLAPAAPHPDAPIEKMARTELTMAMKKHGWLDKEGKATEDALERLTVLGYSGMAEIPNKDFKRVLDAFLIDAAKIKEGIMV